MDFARSINTTDVASPQDTTSFSRFHLFSKLPIELRLAIWELMTLAPRRVLLHNRKYLEVYGHLNQCPVIFKVNQESRALALKRYIVFRPLKYTLDPRQYRYLYPKNDFAVMTLWSMGGLNGVFTRFMKSNRGWEVTRRMTKLLFTGNHLDFAGLLGIDDDTGMENFKPSIQKNFKHFKSLEEVVVELRRCNYPASMSSLLRNEPSGKDTSDVTARLIERDFPVFLDVLQKKPKLKVIVVDWQEGLPEGYFGREEMEKWSLTLQGRVQIPISDGTTKVWLNIIGSQTSHSEHSVLGRVARFSRFFTPH